MQTSNRNSDKDSELVNNSKRAVRTAFIGAIAQFEKGFGYLWGHGKNKENLTDSEKKFLSLWLQVRNYILDCGNEQTRIIDREAEKFIVKWNGYQYKFDFKPRKG